MLNVRYGYNWFVRGTDSNPENHDFDLTSLGFPASYNAVDSRRHPPVPAVRHHRLSGHRHRRRGAAERDAVVHRDGEQVHGRALAARPAWSSGSTARPSNFFANNQTGQFNFDSTWTRGPLDNSTAAPGSLGQSFASFLLGLPSSGSVARAASYDEKSQVWGFFVQDDWRVSATLTVNLGLRYEYETPMTEATTRASRGFDYDRRAGHRGGGARRAMRSTRRRKCRSAPSTSAAA